MSLFKVKSPLVYPDKTLVGFVRVCLKFWKFRTYPLSQAYDLKCQFHEPDVCLFVIRLFLVFGFES